MWNSEAGNVDIADRETCAGLKQLQAWRVFVPRDRGRGEPREIHRNVELACDGRESRHVIGVLVRNQNGSQRLRLAAGGLEALKGIFARQSGIHQKTGSLSCHQGGVSGAGRRENRELKDGALLTYP